MGRLSILMVCTGNICRSPMAEALLRRELHRLGCDAAVVSSAGTWASPGAPATIEAQQAVERKGASLERHSSRPLDPQAVEEADLVVAMTSVHLREIEAIAPGSGDKVRLLKELVELEAPDEQGSDRSPRARLRALLTAPRPARRRALDVDDPIGLPLGAYERCAAEIASSMRALAQWICAEPEPRQTADLG